MSLDQAAARVGGSWVKLENEGDMLAGTILEIDTEKQRTDPEGNVIMSRKSGKPRIVFGLLVQTDERDPDNPDDDGKRRFDANESAQYAILDAFKAWRKENPSGGVEGCKFYLKVAEAKKDTYSQHTYKAKFGERVVSLDEAATSAAAPAPEADPEPF